ncbi:MAG: NAD-dependent epimerase/dehydratase [Xanthobacteraceae bacterium]|nr:MAG: NAD-dependent epimerase/dehydratase [Xanthobacteraceae bacterium]
MIALPTLLITGASGFIGRHVVRALSGDRWQIHGVVRHGADPGVKGVTWHRTDLLRPGAASNLIEQVRPEAIMHLAWNAMPGKFWEAPDNLDWMAASLELYRAFVANGGKRALFAGTCAEYDWSHELLDEADTPLKPATLYGTTKAALFQVLSAAAPRDGVALAWARVFFLYGPFEAEARLVPYVIRALMEERPAECSAGTAERDFMHVEDVAAAMIATLENDYCGPINVASGSCVPIHNIILEIGNQLGRPELIRFGARPTPSGEPRRMAASTTILQDKIGFRKPRSVGEGIAATIDWWRARIKSGG